MKCRPVADTVTIVVYASSREDAVGLLPPLRSGWGRKMDGPESFEPGQCHCESCQGKQPPLGTVWRAQVVDSKL